MIAGNVSPHAELLRRGLAAPLPSIPPRFFYDDLGSRLFAAITALDEYYPTRTEAALLQSHLPAIVAATGLVDCTLIDLGAGNCEKAARMFPTVRPSCYVAVDISTEFLADSLACLKRQYPDLRTLAVATDFAASLALPPEVPTARRLFFYPGSSIGNFTPDEAVAWLRTVRGRIVGEGALWIGVDLQKDHAVIERAYDDALGVTAAFNKNLLRHVNRLAGTDFDLADWRHVAFYDARLGRIEMHLEALHAVTVRWPGGQRMFAAHERIHTENSYKHTVDGFRAMLTRAGFRTVGHWTDDRAWFAFFAAAPEAT